MARRSDPRFTVNEGIDCLLFTAEGPGKAHLLDVSRKGLRLISERKLTEGDTVDIQLKIASIDVELTIETEVCWSEPHASGWWSVGLTLNESIPTETITDWALLGFLDRRCDDRQSLSRTIDVQWQMSQRASQAQLVNFSPGGFCFVCAPAAVDAGERILVSVNNSPERKVIPARVVWQQDIQGAVAVGCSFASQDAYSDFRQSAEIHRNQLTVWSRISHPKVRRRSQWIAVAIALILFAKVVLIPKGFGVLSNAWSAIFGG